MSDQPTPKIVDYFGVYVPSRFPKRSGKPRARRSAQRLAKKFELPLIFAGHSVLIDEIAGDARLAEFAINRKQPPRRGRPRTGGV
jgi:hypothetical protein